MSHLLYHTEGLILASWPSGETGRLFDLFTERLGRVTGLAIGVRELKSKLRYHLQTLTAVQVSLVRGRGPWRIIYAETLALRFGPKDLKKVEPFNPIEQQVVARIFKLLTRLIVEEGRRQRVWREVSNAYHFLSQISLAPAGLADFELLVVWRILTALGYCESSLALAPFATVPFTESLIADFGASRATALLIVEQALYHSHL